MLKESDIIMEPPAWSVSFESVVGLLPNLFSIPLSTAPWQSGFAVVRHDFDLNTLDASSIPVTLPSQSVHNILQPIPPFSAFPVLLPSSHDTSDGTPRLELPILHDGLP